MGSLGSRALASTNVQGVLNGSIDWFNLQMLRFVFNRVCWSSTLFGAAMVGFTARLLLPATVGQGFLPFDSLLAAGLSLVIQATLPSILVLRRTRSDGPETLLADVFLPWAGLFGRPIWLENQQDRLVHGGLWRYSPYAMFGQLIALAALVWWLVRTYEIVALGLVITLTLFGSSALLDWSVGNTGAHAVSFLIASVVAGPIHWSLPPFAEELRISATFIGTYGAVYALWWMWHRLAASSWSPLNNCIRNRFDRIWLRGEMYLPLCFGTRFIHGGPAVIREVKSTAESWRTAVLLLMKRTRYAIMDVSDLDVGTELAWELSTCYRHQIKLLLTCHTDKLDNAVRCVRLILPDAVILPMDFRDVDKLRSTSQPGVAIVQLFNYGEGQDSERFNAQSGVFFGQVSLRDWFRAIRNN